MEVCYQSPATRLKPVRRRTGAWRYGSKSSSRDFALARAYRDVDKVPKIAPLFTLLRKSSSAAVRAVLKVETFSGESCGAGAATGLLWLFLSESVAEKAQISLESPDSLYDESL